MVVSAQGLSLVVVALLYLAVATITFRFLFPRLGPSVKRLALMVLAAQIFVISLAFFAQPSSWFESTLFELRHEFNIQSTVASMQLALAAGTALITARLASSRGAWRGFYFASLGAVFLYLAADEWLKLHERIAGWELYYAALGVMVVAATLFTASRSRDFRGWHICLIAGLAFGGFGAAVLDWFPPNCDEFLTVTLRGCLKYFYWEESLEFVGAWLMLVAVLGQFSEEFSIREIRLARALYLIPVLWFIALILNSFIPRLEARLLARPASTEFQSGVRLHGFRLDRLERSYRARLYVSASQEDILGLGYSIHFVDQETGTSVASSDELATLEQNLWFLGQEYAPLYRQWTEVELLPDAPTNRALWVAISLWREQSGEFKSLKILASDLQLLSGSQAILDELVLPSPTNSASTDVPLASFDGGFTLEAAELPQRARAGETMSMRVTWRADARGTDDYVQFLHIGQEERGQWFVYDQLPLGDRLPTRLWYNGMSDSDTWQVPLPADLEAGSYAIFTGLYDAQDGERLTARDSSREPFLHARVPLGSLTIEAS